MNNYEESLKEIDRLADIEIFKLQIEEIHNSLVRLSTSLQKATAKDLVKVKEQLDKIESILRGE